MNDSNENVTCAEHDAYSDLRFALIIAASAMAFAGIFCNSLLSYIFIRLTKSEPSPSASRLYLLLLSICDVCFCFSFFVIFGLDALALYLHIPILFYLYFEIIIFVFTLSRIVQLTIPYLIIMRTIERFILTSKIGGSSCAKIFTTNATRIGACCAIVSMALMIRLPCAWAYVVKTFNCSVIFGSLQLYPTSLIQNRFYAFVQFYIVNTLGVFIPFLTLVSLNAVIIKNLRGQLGGPKINKTTRNRRRALFSEDDPRKDVETALAEAEEKSGEKKSQLQATVITIVVLVSTYIFCTAPHFVLTILEQFFPWTLKHPDGSSTAVYLLWADLVSVLFCFCSFLRLFIFSTCNPQVRGELFKIFGVKSAKEEGNFSKSLLDGIAEVM